VGTIATGIYRPGQNRLRLGALAVCCAVLPDADTIGLAMGVPYGDIFGHRGFFHSPLFAFLLGLGLVSLFFPQYRPFSKTWSRHVLFLTLVGASHGLLDALTNGGLGIALLSPASNVRYFFPWTPIRVSPISMQRFFTARGMEVIISEMMYVWAPLVTLHALLCWARHKTAQVSAIDKQGDLNPTNPLRAVHSARRASMGSRRAACRAGSTPAARPIRAASNSEKNT
jgi:inner membrane protein